MKKITTIAALFIFPLFFPSAAFSFDGPLQVKNQFPLFIHVDAPYLEKADMEDSFSAGLSYSSDFMRKDSDDWSVRLDMEVAELDIRYKKIISNFIEIGVEVPVLSFDSGFMDSFLNSYHKAFGFPDYGRSTRPNNVFEYEVRRNGALVIKGAGGGIGIGDVKLTAKKTFLKDDPALGLMASVELPTGDAKKGYGSGGFDYGIAVLAEKRLSNKFKAYVNLGAVFPGDLKGQETLNLRDFTYGGVGIEAALWKKFSLLGQVFIQGSPLPKTGISSVDRTAVLLTLGGRYRSSRNGLEVSLTEDPNTAGAPDVSFSISYKRSL